MHQALGPSESSQPQVGIIMGSDSDLPTMKAALEVSVYVCMRECVCVLHVCAHACVCARVLCTCLCVCYQLAPVTSWAQAILFCSLCACVYICACNSFYLPCQPVFSFCALTCLQVLKDFGIEAEINIVSAHRTPELMMDYACSAHKRGLKAIIAGAGTWQCHKQVCALNVEYRIWVATVNYRL